MADTSESEIKRLQDALQSEIDLRARVQRAFAEMIIAVQRGQPITMPHSSLGMDHLLTSLQPTPPPILPPSPSSPFPPASPIPPSPSSPQLRLTPPPSSSGPFPPPPEENNSSYNFSSSVPSPNIFFPPLDSSGPGHNIPKSPSSPGGLSVNISPKIPISTLPPRPSSGVSSRPSGIALALAAKNSSPQKSPLASPQKSPSSRGETLTPVPPRTPSSPSQLTSSLPLSSNISASVSPPGFSPLKNQPSTPSSSSSSLFTVSPGDKKLAEDFRHRGNDLFKQKRYLDAIDMYSRGMQYDPSSSALYFNRAGAYMCIQQYVEAHEDAKKSLEIQPNSVVHLNRLARICIALGDTKTAQESYQAILQLEPTNAMAMKGMVSVAKAEKMASLSLRDTESPISEEDYALSSSLHQTSLASSPRDSRKFLTPTPSSSTTTTTTHPFLNQKALSAPVLGGPASPTSQNSSLMNLSIDEEENNDDPLESPSVTPLKAVSLTKEYVIQLREKYERFKQIRIKLRKQGPANSEDTERTRQATILKLTKSMSEIEEILGIDNRPHQKKGWNEQNIMTAATRFY